MTRLRQDPNTGFYDLPSDFWDEVQDEYANEPDEDKEPDDELSD